MTPYTAHGVSDQHRDSIDDTFTRLNQWNE